MVENPNRLRIRPYKITSEHQCASLDDITIFSSERLPYRSSFYIFVVSSRGHVRYGLEFANMRHQSLTIVRQLPSGLLLSVTLCNSFIKRTHSRNHYLCHISRFYNYISQLQRSAPCYFTPLRLHVSVRRCKAVFEAKLFVGLESCKSTICQYVSAVTKLIPGTVISSFILSV